MKRIARGVLALGVVGFLALGASCKGGDKCEEAMDNVFSLMSEEMGGEMPEEMKEQIESKRAEGLEQCKTALEENPEEMKETLDCLAGAESIEDLSSCKGGVPMPMQ